MKISDHNAIRFAGATACVMTAIASLTACGIGSPYPGAPELIDPSRVRPYEGIVAAPQVAYRIDEHRFFEIVPRTAAACHTGALYYIDKTQGIRSHVSAWEPEYNLRSTFIIDAANDQYLVAPVVRGNLDCSSAGEYCAGPKLPYSVDGGRTWKRGEVSSASDDISVSGSTAYAIGNVARKVNLALGISSLKDWKSVPGYQPDPHVPPLDTKFHCSRNGKE
jgi:hypothetical protein